MTKILVIFTGGTIGSKKNKDGSIDIDESKSYHLLEIYETSNSKKDVIFDTLHPFTILSENLIVSDWLLLKETLNNVNFSNYNGIIITHGSDTLPYTSSAISYMFSNTPIPIVLTASNYPLDDYRSNGLRNFSGCVDFIINEKLPGVFVIFENNYKEVLVHLGTRLEMASSFDYALGNFNFESFKSINFGKMENHLFIRNENEINPKIEDFYKNSEGAKISKASFSSNVLYISPGPGLNYKLYDFKTVKPDAVLHNLYHSGTACIRESNECDYSIIEFVKYCNRNSVDIYIAPLLSISKSQYITSHILLENGAKPLYNISIEAGLVKLMLAYGTFDDKYKIYDFLENSNLFFECFDNVFLKNIKKNMI